MIIEELNEEPEMSEKLEEVRIDEGLDSSSVEGYEIPAARTVELIRDPQCNLGISIVGGRQNEGEVPRFKGIFIKHVLETCPAGKNGLLKTGDQVLEVNLFCSLYF